MKYGNCSEDTELLSLSFRPFYLPKEFGKVFVNVVYIHPRANTKTVAGVIYDTVAKLENIAPDAPKLILGDFNGCSIKNVLPNFYQYANCPTRGERTLDLCFVNRMLTGAIQNHPLAVVDSNKVHVQVPF